MGLPQLPFPGGKLLCWLSGHRYESSEVRQFWFSTARLLAGLTKWLRWGYSAFCFLFGVRTSPPTKDWIKKMYSPKILIDLLKIHFGFTRANQACDILTMHLNSFFFGRWGWRRGGGVLVGGWGPSYYYVTIFGDLLLCIQFCPNDRSWFILLIKYIFFALTKLNFEKLQMWDSENSSTKLVTFKAKLESYFNFLLKKF